MIVHYTSLQDKQRAYVERTVPAILDAALRGRGLSAPATPAELHEWIRAGRYVAEHGPRDHVQDVGQTLAQGGDCEDWAAVELAAAWSRGFGGRLVTAGSTRDHFEHAYVELWDGGRWIPSNPKGNQQGMEYGRHSDWPVLRRWELSDGRVVEADVRGSGVEDPVIRTNSDALKWLTEVQRAKIKAAPGGYNIVESWRKGYGNQRLSQLLTLIKEDFAKRAVAVQQATGQLFQASDFPDIFEAKDLEDVNLVMASEWSADMLAPGPAQAERVQALRQFAVGIGGNPAANDTQLAAVAAYWLAITASNVGVVVDDWLEAQQQDPNASADQLLQRLRGQSIVSGGKGDFIVGRVLRGSGESFFGKLEDGFRTLVRHPLKWLRRVFVTEIGKGVRQLADNILAADKSAPWLSQFFLRPLGFHLQATFLHELGNSMVDGSISTFNEKALVIDTGQTMTAAGQALLVAAPFLPPPYNIAAAAVGALSIAAGKLLIEAVDKSSPLHTGKLGQDQVITEEQPRQEAPAPDPYTQQPGEWRYGADGLAYGWDALGTQRWWWTALVVQNGVVAQIWFWDDVQTGGMGAAPRGWRQLA